MEILWLSRWKSCGYHTSVAYSQTNSEGLRIRRKIRSYPPKSLAVCVKLCKQGSRLSLLIALCEDSLFLAAAAGSF